MFYRVSATSLNLRSEPRVSPTNRLAVLHQSQRVEKLAEANPASWWKVATPMDGTPMEGFVASQYLAAETEAPITPAADQVTAVHLTENRPDVKRSSTGGRAFPLGEPGRPSRGNGSAAQRASDLEKIIQYLDVEHSPRYRAGAGSTYCNIYAYDYCYLSGVYLPRVWWTSKSISRLEAGQSVPVQYADTVTELNANSLYGWLREFGAEFGWSRTTDLETIQQAANQGGVGIICAQRTDLNRPGHICAVAPENPPHTALRREGKVVLPLQSQAGARNFSYSSGTSKWWAGAQFRAFGFWTHA